MQNAESLRDLTTECVRCGLCLPHCPTYQLNQEEMESPRGRIAMLAASAAAELSWQPSIQKHIDQCLACGHCERVCPAHVQYNTLLMRGREHLAQKHPIAWRKRIGIKIMETPRLRTIGYACIVALQILGLWKSCIAISAFFSKKLAVALRLIPTAQHTVVATHRMPAAPAKKVLLFPGCCGKIFSQPTLSAARQLLLTCGYQAVEPNVALCCGALSAHAGLSEHTMHLTAQALQCLCAEQKITDVIMIATGCSSFAKKMTAQQPSLHIVDIQRFVQDHWPIKNAPLNSKPLRIAVHTPCTQTNGLGNARLSYDLLSRLPQATLIPFGENSCCGASGSYMLENPKTAEQFAKQLLTEKLLDKCDIIVTSNIGCQLHFQNFLATRKISIRVCHPIELLME